MASMFRPKTANHVINEKVTIDTTGEEQKDKTKMSVKGSSISFTYDIR